MMTPLHHDPSGLRLPRYVEVETSRFFPTGPDSSPTGGDGSDLGDLAVPGDLGAPGGLGDRPAPATSGPAPDDGGGRGPLGGGGSSRRGPGGQAGQAGASRLRYSGRAGTAADQDLMAWPLFDKIVRELGDLGYSG